MQQLRIQPSRAWVPLNLREVWQYRDLLILLAVRDIKVRYKQAVLGMAWAVLQPLLIMLVFNLLFGLLMGASNKPSPQGIPYAVSTLCATVPWMLFATSLSQAGNSVISERRLITKVYFPRLIVPLAPILAALVDFGIGLGLLLVVMLGYGLVPTMAVLVLPLFVLFAVLAALSVALWLAALNAMYRDVRYAIPMIVQCWMFVSPVIYATERLHLPPWALAVYGLNPMVGVIEGFRWALLGAPAPSAPLLLASTSAVVVLLIGGLFYFRRMERTFADLV